jgi:AcrR family transcriptional regulator
MSPRERRTLDGGRARDREVIEAAIQIFWEKGYSATSVQDVADALGMLKGSLYYYIDSKESLLDRIFADSHEEVRGIVDEVLGLDLAPLERLHTFVERLALWYLTNVRRASLYAREWRHAGDGLRGQMLEQRQYYDAVLLDLIRQALAEGHVTLPEGGERIAANFVMSAISSLPDWFRSSGPQPAIVVARTYADMTLCLLRAQDDLGVRSAVPA